MDYAVIEVVELENKCVFSMQAKHFRACIRCSGNGTCCCDKARENFVTYGRTDIFQIIVFTSVELRLSQ